VKVLVVDDERALRTALRRALLRAGYEVLESETGEHAIALLSDRAVDATILDVLMPGIDGLEVCRRLRAAGDRTPILMLTARETIADRVAGLEAGADDYLTKPFALAELLARVKALLRRATPDAGADRLRFGPLDLDLRSHTARVRGRAVELTRTEAQLLELFLRNPRHVLTRSTINERVWGYDFGPSSNSLGVYIGYLRRKLEEDGEARLLHTVRGVGYVLRER
jgi:two-component system response regulator MprA